MSTVVRQIKDPAEAKAAGYVAVTQEQALQYARETVEGWEPSRDTLSLRLGPVLSTVMASVPGLLMSAKIRNLHGLQTVTAGRVPTGLFSAVVPWAVTSMLSFGVVEDIIMNETQCYVCLETKTVAKQLLGGVALPAFLALSANHFVMAGLATRNVPRSFGKEVFFWAAKMVRKCGKILAVSAAVQAVVTVALTRHQHSSWQYINDELLRRMEEDKKSTK